ncbi:ABC transporter ATP-binding protein [Paenibacillus polymyxa]|uniref:ABC transporter ATP-binding protein n=1 Tax=Paenibacillus polymyxa TaxID=1406 RepID=UPI0025B72F45|nr:ABC transporter ATP-binding protein [Paenibacillus polymyxa]MDN4084227.1 ABC transporter ATP-binding protein [Paenibacillus polymyxa]MDN4088795.1 ABC transporter ATP-binding protein [Paenibacillus polymyxa]MDN4108239.1 ABC transporter ATP-binding protein [Paenibacillus polymyxa]
MEKEQHGRQDEQEDRMKEKPGKRPDKAGMGRFIKLIASAHPPKAILIIALILTLVQTIAGLIVPMMTKGLIDGLTFSSLNRMVIIGLLGAFVLQAVASAVSIYMLNYAGHKIVANLRKRLWHKILSLPIPYFDRNRSGDTMSRVTNDTSLIMNLITEYLVNLISNVIAIIGGIALLFYLDWVMTLIILTIVPLTALILFPVGRKMYRISKKQQDEMADLTSVLSQVIGEIRLVKAYGTESREAQAGEDRIYRMFRFGLQESRILALVGPISTFLLTAVLVIILGVGGVRVASGVLTAGDLVAFILLLFQVITPMAQFTTLYSRLQKVVGATERIQTILDHEEEPLELKQEASKESRDIVFRDVAFSYTEGEEVLHRANLVIPANRTTAFVGPSGSGKSTLFSLLERFYVPDTGEIRYGDESISSYTLSSWRSKIGYVSQESSMMTGTVRDNITYGLGREADLEEVRRAAMMAYADTFIMDLPQGYDTEVGERGMKLSGGQRQRIAIARALLRSPDILMLDEATSSLDSSSEHEVQKALANLMEGRTTIVIAHRLSTVVHSDQIIVLDKGNVTGAGTHAELLETHQVYRELAQKQFVEMGERSMEY